MPLSPCQIRSPCQSQSKSTRRHLPTAKKQFVTHQHRPMSQHKVWDILIWVSPLGPPHLSWVPPLGPPHLELGASPRAPLGQTPQPMSWSSSMSTLSSIPSTLSMSHVQPGIRPLRVWLPSWCMATRLQQGFHSTNPLSPVHQQPTHSICYFLPVYQNSQMRGH